MFLTKFMKSAFCKSSHDENKFIDLSRSSRKSYNYFLFPYYYPQSFVVTKGIIMSEIKTEIILLKIGGNNELDYVLPTLLIILFLHLFWNDRMKKLNDITDNPLIRLLSMDVNFFVLWSEI